MENQPKIYHVVFDHLTHTIVGVYDDGRKATDVINRLTMLDMERIVDRVEKHQTIPARAPNGCTTFHEHVANHYIEGQRFCLERLKHQLNEFKAGKCGPVYFWGIDSIRRYMEFYVDADDPKPVQLPPATLAMIVPYEIKPILTGE